MKIEFSWGDEVVSAHSLTSSCSPAESSKKLTPRDQDLPEVTILKWQSGLDGLQEYGNCGKKPESVSPISHPWDPCRDGSHPRSCPSVSIPGSTSSSIRVSNNQSRTGGNLYRSSGSIPHMLSKRQDAV